MNPINDKPIEHTSRFGTTFICERADLRATVHVSFKWENSSAQQKADYAEFAAWHALNIHSQLNGFSGYDCITFEEQPSQ